tara:strand:- start:725 stop:3256 length:2532 start_codon:yes stop_codon:yes gene_type:complete
MLFQTYDWKIKCENTIFNGSTEFREVINGNLLKRIIESGYDCKYDSDKWYGFDCLRNHLIAMSQRVQNNMIKAYPKIDRRGVGRAYYPQSISIGHIPYKVRHTLLKDTYIDLDMDNAHFNLLVQYCKKANIPKERYSIIEYYCDNRETMIENIVLRYFNIKKGDTAFKEKRSLVKTLFIRCGLYLGSFNKWKNDNKLDDFHNEDDKICLMRSQTTDIAVNYIIQNNQELYNTLIDEIKEKKNKNRKYHKDPNSTIMSYFLQNLEREVMEKVLVVCRDNFFDKNLFTYCSDGFLIPIYVKDRIEKEEQREICSVLKNITLDETDFDISWSIKPFVENIMPEVIDLEINKPKAIDFNKFTSISINMEEQKKLDKVIAAKNEPDIYKMRENINRSIFNRQQKYFEEYNFKVLGNSTYGRINDNEIQILNENRFKILYKSFKGITVDNNNRIKRGKNASFIDLWDGNSNIRKYEKTDFLPPPLDCPINSYNTFTGFRAERIKTDYCNENIDIFLNHMWNLTGGSLYDKDKVAQKYLINYLAHLIQKPGEIPKISLVFCSKQGVGKNLFFDNFGKKILGEQYLLSTADLDKVVGRFNINRNKLLVVMDEAQGKDTFSNSEKIKNMIDAPSLVTEEKGITPTTMTNNGRYIFLSNGETPVKVTQDDRRMVVFASIMPLHDLDLGDENENKNHREEHYFDPLYNAFQDDDMVFSFYRFLKEYKIDYSLKSNRPITEKYKDLQSVNVATEVRFIEYWCSKRLNHPKNDIYKDGIISFEDFYKKYKDYCITYNYKSIDNVTYNALSRKINNFVNDHGNGCGVDKYKHRFTQRIVVSFNYKECLNFMKKKNII